MNNAALVNHDAVKTPNLHSKDAKLVEKVADEQGKSLFHQIQNRKVLCIILAIAIVAVIIAAILIPTFILKKDKNLPAARTTITTMEQPRPTTTIIVEAPEPTIAQQLGLISLNAVEGNVFGVYNTSIGGDSMNATPGKGKGQYVAHESPDKVCDGIMATKYLSYGPCGEGTDAARECGLGTGFYLELQRGPTLVNGLQLCTAGDYPNRDPTFVSLEGSNSTGTNLTLGSSWTLLYNGTSGIVEDTDRQRCGLIQYFNNTIAYKSYRLLVLDKRDLEISVHYAEVQLYRF